MELWHRTWYNTRKVAPRGNRRAAWIACPLHVGTVASRRAGCGGIWRGAPTPPCTRPGRPDASPPPLAARRLPPARGGTPVHPTDRRGCPDGGGGPTPLGPAETRARLRGGTPTLNSLSAL